LNWLRFVAPPICGDIGKDISGINGDKKRWYVATVTAAVVGKKKKKLRAERRKMFWGMLMNG
jgi:hypothetical protein